MLQNTKNIIFSLFILGIFFSGIGFANSTLWEGVNERNLESARMPGMIPSGDKIRPFLFGFDTLGADSYWLKTVQYTGSNVRSEDKAGLYPLVNLVTDLDAHFWRAYRNGILLLPDTDQKEETKKLLKKAEQNLPQRWEPFYMGGFYYYFYENDYDTAIEKYTKCTEISGCLGGANRMIRNLEAKRGRYSIAIDQYLEEIQNPDLSDDDYDLFRKKIEESAKLLILNDAAQKMISSKKEISTLEDLINFSFSPEQETSQIAYLINNNSSLFDFQFSIDPQGYITITSQNLNPAFIVNEMEWSTEEKRVRTRVF